MFHAQSTMQKCAVSEQFLDITFGHMYMIAEVLLNVCLWLSVNSCLMSFPLHENGRFLEVYIAIKIFMSACFRDLFLTVVCWIVVQITLKMKVLIHILF